MRLNQLFHTLVVNCIAVLAISQNNISVQTIVPYSSTQIFALDAIDDQIVWIADVMDTLQVHYYDGKTIQILKSPGLSQAHTVAITETTVAWTALSLTNPSGACTAIWPFSMSFFEGTAYVNNEPCAFKTISNKDNYLKAYFFGSIAFEIYDANDDLLVQIPTTYQGIDFNVSRFFSYWGDYVFFQGSYQNLAGSEIDGIFRYKVKEDILEIIFIEDDNSFAIIPDYKNDSTMVIVVDDFISNQRALYYYDGINGSTLITPDSNQPGYEPIIFKNQVFWTTTSNELIRYDISSAAIDTIENDSVGYGSLNASDCYLTWSKDDNTNYKSTLHFYDGTNFMTEDLDGVFNNKKLQIDNEGFSAVLFRRNGPSFSSEYKIVQGKFDVACCTGEDIVTSKNPDESSSSYIESSTLFSCNLSPVYNAVDYIEMKPGFEVPENYSFCGEMRDECVLYQE